MDIFVKRILFILLLFFIPLHLFGIENFKKLCNEEVLKEKINKTLILKYCSKVGKEAEKNKKLAMASWYYLLIGDLNKNINEIEPKIDNGFLANIGHSYLLKEDFNKTQKMYKTFLENAEIPWADNTMQDSFKILLKFYPKQIIKKGLNIWNELYKPLKSVNLLHKKYQQAKREHKYNKAIEYLEKIIEFEKKYYNNMFNISNKYNNIGVLYKSIGKYQKALEYFQKSLDIIEKTLGKKNNLDSATRYNNMGIVYESMGEHSKALEYYQKALNIKEKILDKDNSSIARSYNNIGGVYHSIGNYSKALEYYQKTLKILGTNHPFTPTIYNNIGGIYHFMGNFPKAIEYCQKALKRKEKILTKNHPSTAISYNLIGGIYNSMEEYQKALVFHKKALNIREKILGKNHPSTAISYNNIGFVYKNIGEYQKALIYYKKALNIREKTLGKNHSFTATSYNNMGMLYDSIRKYDEAYLYLNLSFKIFIKNRYKNFTILNSKEKEKYIKQHISEITFLLNISDKYLSQLTREDKKIKTIQQETLTNWLKYKGTLFEYENILTIIESTTNDKSVKKEIVKWRILTKKLANLEQKYSFNTTPKKYKEKINTTQQQIDKIQISLSKKDEDFKNILGLKDINSKKISSILKNNQLYIDFAKIDKNYYIFTLDKNNQITFKKISEKDTTILERNIENFKIQNKEVVKKITNKDLKLKEKKEAITQLKYKSQIILSNLYDIIIKTYLSTQLKDKKELIISPDGLLNFLPFEALYHNGKYLIEDYKISYISSGREFVRQTKREKANPKYEMICFGNPDFNASLPISNTKDMPNLTPLDRWEDYQNFSPIGDAEINITRDMYPNAIIYEKKDATIKNLMKIESPRILHFSTHGKFLINDEIKNPMLKAGLAFTGANKKLDGIATALKLSALDLKDTELVVLSACESGLGEVQNSEGVMGLPKAFLQAGARDVMMSLWSVSNQKTADLMEYFYKNLKKNQDYSTALRNSKLKMIKKDMHPYYWSAFIMHGIQN